MLAWVLLLGIGEAQDASPEPPSAEARAEALLASFDHEPSVRQVQVWAEATAEVDPESVRRWLRSSQTFAALPELRAELRVADDYGNSFAVFDADGNEVTSNQGPRQDVLTDSDVGQTRTVVVRATWDLDKLVMSSERLRALAVAQDAAKLREKVVVEVTRLYFERRRAQADALLVPRVDAAGRVREALHLAELTAALDAYTAGRFSEAVGR